MTTPIDAIDMIVGARDRLLVTGAAGFIGKRLVRSLLQRGFSRVRCLVRPTGNRKGLEETVREFSDARDVEIIEGNLLSEEDCAAAVRDVAVIYHLAAGRGSKSFPDAFMNSAVATRNLLRSATSAGSLRRFVNVSSFSVYTNQGKRRRRLLDETCPIESHPELRGDAYCFAKVKQEEIVAEYVRECGVPCVTLRPGVVFGPGKEAITGRVGLSGYGVFLHLGGFNPIPFTYIDNCADAIAVAGLKRGIDGEAFNVVDDDLATSWRFLSLYKSRVSRFRSIYLPHAASYLLCYLWEKYSAWSQGQLPPVYNRRAWHAYWKRTRYSNEKLKDRLGWRPETPLNVAFSRFFESCRQEGSTVKDCDETGDGLERGACGAAGKGRAAQAAGMRAPARRRPSAVSSPPLKVAVVGCGKIADAHVSQIERVAGCEIVGVCDREILMARQLYERFAVRRYFGDLKEMLRETKPDVVHITTPPQSHFPLARECLNAGSHVYLEKPFTTTREEAEELIALSTRLGLKITAGHDDQFSPAARQMREMIHAGYLGDGPVHMESCYGYELGGAGYANALLGDKKHWVRGLPGGLMHNIISHGIARIAEFLTSDNPEVVACGFISPALTEAGETSLMDELRTIIRDENGTTAYFTFSSQMKPSLHQFRIYGTVNGLCLDRDNETLIKLPGMRRVSYLEQFLPPIDFARQYLGNLKRNIGLFLANDFHPKAGMKHLIQSFYQAIAGKGPLPIAYREIILVARIMDSLFEQINAQAKERVRSARSGAET